MSRKRRAEHWSDVLSSVDDCFIVRRAQRWCRQFSTLQQAWKACRKPSYLVWWLKQTKRIYHNATGVRCPLCRLQQSTATEIRKRFPKAPAWKARRP